jgi:hypothetical protein
MSILERLGKEVMGMMTWVQSVPILCPAAKSLSLTVPVEDESEVPLRDRFISTPGEFVLI